MSSKTKHPDLSLHEMFSRMGFDGNENNFFATGWMDAFFNKDDGTVTFQFKVDDDESPDVNTGEIITYSRGGTITVTVPIGIVSYGVPEPMEEPK